MMEIFDVTQTDPSLLIKDQLDHSLDTSFLRFRIAQTMNSIIMFLYPDHL